MIFLDCFELLEYFFLLYILGKISVICVNSVFNIFIFLFFFSGAVAATSVLHQKANDIRQRPVTWQSYHKSQMISDRDFKFITAYELIKPENRVDFLKTNANQTAETFLSLLTSLSKDQTIQYVLCLIDEILLEDKSRVDIFHDFCNERKESLWKQFFNLLHRDDAFIKNMVNLFLKKLKCTFIIYSYKRIQNVQFECTNSVKVSMVTSSIVKASRFFPLPFPTQHVPFPCLVYYYFTLSNKKCIF